MTRSVTMVCADPGMIGAMAEMTVGTSVMRSIVVSYNLVSSTYCDNINPFLLTTCILN